MVKNKFAKFYGGNEIKLIIFFYQLLHLTLFQETSMLTPLLRSVINKVLRKKITNTPCNSLRADGFQLTIFDILKF